MVTPQPGSLHGQAVRLRPVTTDDAPRLTEILTHPEVARWWGRYDPDRVHRELVDPDDGTVTFTIQTDGRLIGLIQYLEEPDPDYRHAALDIFLHPDWHGRGRGADAIRTLARHLFAQRGHHRPPSTRPPTTSGRSAPTGASASGLLASCAATSAGPTAPGTTGC